MSSRPGFIRATTQHQGNEIKPMDDGQRKIRTFPYSSTLAFASACQQQPSLLHLGSVSMQYM